MKEKIMITVADAHASNLCSRGLANKLKSLGYDRAQVMQFLKHGMPIEEARSLNDAQVDAVIRRALELRERRGEHE